MEYLEQMKRFNLGPAGEADCPVYDGMFDYFQAWILRDCSIPKFRKAALEVPTGMAQDYQMAETRLPYTPPGFCGVVANFTGAVWTVRWVHTVNDCEAGSSFRTYIAAWTVV